MNNKDSVAENIAVDMNEDAFCPGAWLVYDETIRTEDVINDVKRAIRDALSEGDPSDYKSKAVKAYAEAIDILTRRAEYENRRVDKLLRTNFWDVIITIIDWGFVCVTAFALVSFISFLFAGGGQ